MYRVPWIYGRLLCGTYYRFERIGGQVPARGPLLVVTNHSNGLVDGGMLFLATARPLRIIIKSTILRMPVVGPLARWAGCVPVYRKQDNEDTSKNQDAFRAVHAALREGGAISIFPEGTSVDPLPGLRPFRGGAARMALGAEAADPPAGVKILPVGLVYEERDAFRSRAYAWIGEPRGVEHLREEYARDPEAAVARLTAEIEDQVRAVTLELEEFSDRARLDAAERLLPGDERTPTARLQDLAGGLRWLREHRPDEARSLLDDLARLGRRPLTAGLGSFGEAAPPSTLPGRMIAGALVVLWAFAVLTCVLPWLPVLGPIQLLARYARPSADKFVTMILVSASVLIPIWTALAVALATAAA
ncbi:MAG: 1-acyl-sn-glycerol-3-phosphate acyltransferase, partial [Planctomycetota bacterium]